MSGVVFCCPDCHMPLSDRQDELSCAKCGSHYPVVDGIPIFAARDDFYEGRWAEPDLSAGSPRNWLVKKERFFVRSLRGKRGRLLDLGCGGGWRVFAAVGWPVGIDLSLASLKAARALYPDVAVASLDALPFPDAFFDYVVSSDVLGHVPHEGKDRVVGELARVLKKGGRTLHYVEADSDDPLSRFAKRDGQLYRRHIVEPEGHVGVEKPREIMERFRRAGFRPVREIPSYKLFLYVNRVVQYFDNEYRGRSRGLAVLVALCKVLTRFKPLEMGTNVALSLAFEAGDRLFPADWANGLLVEYER